MEMCKTDDGNVYNGSPQTVPRKSNTKHEAIKGHGNTGQ